MAINPNLMQVDGGGGISGPQVEQGIENAYYTSKVGTTGKTQAQLDALKNAQEVAKLTGGTVDPVTGYVIPPKKVDTSAADKAAADKAAADKAAADAAAAKAAQDAANATTAAQIAAAEKAARDARAAQLAAEAALAAANGKVTQAAADAAAAATKNINQSGNVALPTVSAADQAAIYQAEQLKLQKEQERQSIMLTLQDRFTKYGLTSLAAKIKSLAVEGATEATITLQLQETPEYQQRFKANADRIKNNLAVLTPAEYLNVEDSYRQILRSYGLKQFDTDEYVSQFISNDISPTELSNRVQIAVQRVQNADPAISKTLRDYYGIGNADLVAYTLDPATQFQKIQLQVQAAEVGTAARLQGLETGVGVAEQLAKQGVTQAEAQKGYATIADILPTAEKLSSIYGSTLGTYGQSEAEQEVFNSLASAQRARQRLTAREIAQFSGSSGLAKNALTSGGGQI